jgi:hypothetical protein
MAALQTMQVMGDEVKHHTLGTHPDVPDPTMISLESILDGDDGGLLEMLDDQGSIGGRNIKLHRAAAFTNYPSAK